MILRRLDSLTDRLQDCTGLCRTEEPACGQYRQAREDAHRSVSDHTQNEEEPLIYSNEVPMKHVFDEQSSTR